MGKYYDYDYLNSIPVEDVLEQMGVDVIKGKCYCINPNCSDNSSKKPGASINKKNTIKPRKLKPLKEILILNSNYSSSDLKKRLIYCGLKHDICEICGQKNIWNNKPLTLQLHHINGDHYDNRLENLQRIRELSQNLKE